ISPMHNEDNRSIGGSGWSLNTITDDLSHLLDHSTSSELFSMLTPQRSVNSLASSSTALSSSLPSQFSLPSISYNEIFRGLSANFCQPGPSTSSAPLNPILLQQDLIVQQHLLHNVLGHRVGVQSSPSVASSSNYDTQSVHSAINRAKKRSITETRRTSLPPTSFAAVLFPSSSSQFNGFIPPSELRMNSPLTERQSTPNGEAIEENTQVNEVERKLAYEEFRRRPAPIIPDSYPRAPTPEDFGELTENNYLPSHFFKGTKILLPDGTKKTVENLITDDFIMCATSSADVLMQTSSIDFIEKNALVYRITFGVGFGKERIDMEVSPEQPFFIIGQGWSSCAPEKTLQIYGLKARLVQQGDVCISLTSFEYQSEETTRALEAVVGQREAALEAAEEANKYNTYHRTVGKISKKSKKNRAKDRRRRREGRLSEPPPDSSSPKKWKRERRCRSVEPQWQTSLPPLRPSKPFSPKQNKPFPSHCAFDFEI
ncbi:hypothetical protein PFISCL1PPCAC_19487, partial [Pristionchus fissidentatus]